MKSEIFRFKKFSIAQNSSVMKVGTDGVLLGAWANVQSKTNILDIGSGTGIVALMIAQRLSNSRLTCLDISKEAAETTLSNFQSLPINCQFEVYQIALQEFHTQQMFELITCNPPYFKVTSESPLTHRNISRQHRSLDFNQLIEYSVLLLSDEGCLSVIIPFEAERLFHIEASNNRMYLQRKCTVFPSPDLPAKRVLLEYGLKPVEMKEESLIIENNGRHQYSEAYKNLTKDFYLAF